MQKLGVVTHIEDLKSIWKHEAHDFTPWLAKEENLSLLGDAIGIDIVLNETESSVGNFSADIYAQEAGTGRKIIIENQLENTNHDHLGKIITYISGKDASIAIWIVKYARDEHRQAIQWLNEHTNADVDFFLVELEVIKVDDSRPAVLFNVVAQPNDWLTRVKDNLPTLQLTQLHYWEAFKAYTSDHSAFNQALKPRKPHARSYLDVRTSVQNPLILLSMNVAKQEISAAIYIRGIALFEHYEAHKENIEQELNMTLKWHTAQLDCRITATKCFDLSDSTNWHQAFEWYCAIALQLNQIIIKYKP